MKAKILGPISKAPDGTWQSPHHLFGLGHLLDVSSSYDPNITKPQKLFCDGAGSQTWAYRGLAVSIFNDGSLSPEQVQLEVMSAIVKKDKYFSRLRREIEAFENFDRIDVSRRERIPDSVRLFVWQRDQGKCVKCGQSEKLEFDHVIPVAKGGSNTERNIQLLCESCNRSKGVNI